jgi:hypothetical protein
VVTLGAVLQAHALNSGMSLQRPGARGPVAATPRVTVHPPHQPPNTNSFTISFTDQAASEAPAMTSVVITQDKQDIGRAIDEALGKVPDLARLVHDKLVTIKPNDTYADEKDRTGVTQPDTLRAVHRYVKRAAPSRPSAGSMSGSTTPPSPSSPGSRRPRTRTTAGSSRRTCSATFTAPGPRSPTSASRAAASWSPSPPSSGRSGSLIPAPTAPPSSPSSACPSASARSCSTSKTSTSARSCPPQSIRRSSSTPPIHQSGRGAGCMVPHRGVALVTPWHRSTGVRSRPISRVFYATPWGRLA